MRDITHIVIHCAATKNGDAAIKLADLDKMHRDKGWRKIGYHFVVEIDGSVREGRQLEEIGAHVEGNNAKSIGICMVGTDKFTDAQWQSLRTLVADLQQRFSKAETCGHRDFSPDRNGDGLIDAWEWFKLCPGFDVKAWLLAGMDPLWDARHVHS